VKRAFAAALLGGGGHVGRRRLEAPRRVDALPRARVTGRGGARGGRLAAGFARSGLARGDGSVSL